jgi:spermidine/putrescine transport system substrate-binding protein
VNFANWPYYIDTITGSDNVLTFPSLLAFEDQTGIEVNYRPVIDDAEIFFQELQPLLAAHQPTGWDIMVITNGQTMTKLIQLGYLMELPADQRPNFDANADPEGIKDPAYDPGNKYTMAWQSGITGIGYNPLLTGRDITSLNDLFSMEFAGQVGMFSDPVDLPNLALLAVGVKPEDSTPNDWKKAADLLRKQRQDKVVAGAYAQQYIAALSSGDLALSMAWSGDIFQANNKIRAHGGTELKFVVPKEGALLWTDSMVVPQGAQNTEGAIKLMDYVYDPNVAADIALGANYITPVPGARDVLQERAADPGENDDAAALQALADSPLVFPSEADKARLHSYRELVTDDDIAQWNAVFAEFYG